MLRTLRRPWALSTMGAVVVLAVVGVWWFGFHDRAAASTPEATTQTVAASTTTLEKTVTGTGTIAPTVLEDVSFAVSGTVTSVDVAAGDTVTEGQALATVDTLQLDADLLAAKATLATAEANLADLADNDDGSDAADAQIASAEAQVELAEASVTTAEEAVGDATLVAPAGGLLTAVNLEVGDAVTGTSGSSGASGSSGSGTAAMGSTTTTSSSSTAQFEIVGTDSWTTQISVDDSDVALIEVGDQVELTIDDVADTVFGTVSEIGLLSTSTGGVAAYPVTIEITGSPDGVHDGVSADVSIVYERRTDVLTVPSSAVRTVDGESVVTQLDADGNEVTTTVEVGETVDDMTEITSGLTEGDEVVVTVVAQTDGSDSQQTDQSGQMPTDMGSFDPSQMQGGQMPGGQMPGVQMPGSGNG